MVLLAVDLTSRQWHGPRRREKIGIRGPKQWMWALWAKSAQTQHPPPTRRTPGGVGAASTHPRDVMGPWRIQTRVLACDSEPAAQAGRRPRRPQVATVRRLAWTRAQGPTCRTWPAEVGVGGLIDSSEGIAAPRSTPFRGCRITSPAHPRFVSMTDFEDATWTGQGTEVASRRDLVTCTPGVH